MNLAQIIASMAGAGCTLEQVAAVAAEHERLRLERAVRRRCQRAVAAALFPVADRTRPAGPSPVSPQSNADSAAPGTGAATAAGGTQKSVARAALLMMPGLRPAARRVGARLIESYNLGSGRCDPSVVGMARQEGLDARSVRRALGELEAAGLIRRVVHGAGRRNAYRLDWAVLRGHAAAAENGAPAKADSAATRTPASGNPDNRVLPNLRTNTKTFGASGTRRVRSPDPRQGEMLLPIAGRRAAAANRSPADTGSHPVEGAIRGKYRSDHEQLRTMLAVWWGLDEAERDGISNLAAFEAWLRLHGPPQQRRSG